MKGLVVTHEGFEDIAAQEVQELISAQRVVQNKGTVCFECTSLTDLATLAYSGRLFLDVLLVLSAGAVSGVPILDMALVKPFLDKRAVCRVERSGEHDFTSFEVESSWNGALKQQGVEIDHKMPQTIVTGIIVDELYWAGIGMAGIDLGKRPYRIFLGPNSLKGSVAAGLLRIVNFKAGESLCDPFCRQGIIPIEAALMATNTSPQKFIREKLAFNEFPNQQIIVSDAEKESTSVIISMDEDFKNIASAKKNAKIAGVTKQIEFSRTDLKWLDAKFGKHFLDALCTMPPQPSRLVLPEKIEKIYHQFFYQAEFILKKKGRVLCCITAGFETLSLKAKEFGFISSHQRTVKTGDKVFTVVVFKKSQVS